MENKPKHLEFIQAVINRMSGNSFLLKGWAITLVAVIFALFVKDTNHAYIFIAYFPIIVFWILDGYFISQERLFRSLYDQVRKIDEKDIDFSMNINGYKEKGNGWLYSIFSSTLLFFYVSLVVVMLVVIYFIS